MTLTPELLTLRDVKLLLEAPLDRAYLDEWATRLELDGLLKEAEHE